MSMAHSSEQSSFTLLHHLILIVNRSSHYNAPPQHMQKMGGFCPTTKWQG